MWWCLLFLNCIYLCKRVCVCVCAIPVRTTSPNPTPSSTICHTVAKLQSSAMDWFLMGGFLIMNVTLQCKMCFGLTALAFVEKNKSFLWTFVKLLSTGLLFYFQDYLKCLWRVEVTQDYAITVHTHSNFFFFLLDFSSKHITACCPTLHHGDPFLNVPSCSLFSFLISISHKLTSLLFTSSLSPYALVRCPGCMLANTLLSLQIKRQAMLSDTPEQNISFFGHILVAFCCYGAQQ